jgi:hypothetical protein
VKHQLIIRENVFYRVTGPIKHIDNALPSPASYHQIFFFKKRITGEGRYCSENEAGNKKSHCSLEKTMAFLQG